MQRLRPPLGLLLLALVLAWAVAACGGGDDEPEPRDRPASGEATASPAGARIRSNPDNARTQITIGSKNFTEQRVLGEIFAQGLAAAGYDVDAKLSIGNEYATLRALEAGEIDAYPEYTGTALLSFFGVEADDVPKDPMRAYELARDAFADDGLTALPPTPFTSSNEVAVTQETAQRERLETISDLEGKARELTLYGSEECRIRRDCLVGLREIYGLRFGRFVEIPVPERHRVLTSGRADVSIVFTTDPQIKRDGLVLLEDDRGMFPPYNSTLVMQEELAEQAGPDLSRTVELIQRDLTDEAMQELNARVDLDGKEPAAVAREYLSETGLVRD